MRVYLFFCTVCLAVTIAYAQPNSGTVTGRLASPELKEISGVAPSARHPGIFYVHNDSGDPARFFAVTPKGKLLAMFYFTNADHSNINVKDCEDIAAGPGPEKGEHYIYLADIGDNIGWRNTIKVYRFKEPGITKPADTIIAATYTLKYPDGARDAETLMVDPVDKMIYILSKREDSVGIYGFPINSSNASTIVMQSYGRIFFQGKRHDKWVLSGDISSNGKGILVKTNNGVYYFKRQGSEPVYQTLQHVPVQQKKFIPHGQQEAIAFAHGNKGYYVMAEGKNSPVYYYTLEQ
jgi:hypothetical protein